MALSWRGVLEAGHGRAWSWLERERLIDFLAAHGFNLFVYAAEHDPLRQHRWQEPYLPEEVERFARLAERAVASGVEFCLALRPEGCHDAGALWQKLAPLHAAGLRSFLLQGAGGSGEAVLANALLAELERAEAGRPYPRPVPATERPVRLSFQPAAGGPAYLKALGARLDPAVAVLWAAACAPALSARALQAASDALGRPLLCLDAYPGAPEVGLRTPPLRGLGGREAVLGAAAAGILFTLGPLPEAAKVALHTCATWAADPDGYVPGLAWEQALLAVSGDMEDASAVGNLGHFARSACLEPGADNPLAPKLQQFWQRWGGSDRPLERQAAIAVLARELTRLRWKAERLLGKLANPYLQAELEPWAKKLLGWVETAELGLELLRLGLVDPGDARLGALREKVLLRSAALREDPHAVADDQFDPFCRRCLWAWSGH